MGIDDFAGSTDPLGSGDLNAIPVPDAVDLVLECGAMEAVFAAQRLLRVEAMHRELLEASDRRFVSAEMAERSIRLELAAAMRITEHAAGMMLAHADALVRRYPAALDALAGARITLKHAEVLIEGLSELSNEQSAPLIEQVVKLAEAEPVGAFRRALRHLVERTQAATLDERHEAALQTRRIAMERGYDGMGTLLVHAPEVELHAIFQRASTIAKAIMEQEGDGSRTLDQVRADVVCDLLVDGTTEATPAAERGMRASVVVTVPALSLLDDGAARALDQAVVEGVGPIPNSVARRLCGGDTRWMRVLTHPETGMVLSVGREQYSPPAALRKLTKWRADRCMGPGCWMPASRCEIDHTVAWQDGGHTSLENHAPLCKGHHIVKHHGGWLVEQVAGSGGALRWTSPTGRTYVVNPERRVPTFRSTEPAPF